MSGIDHLLDTNVVIGLLKGHEAAISLAREAGLSLRAAGVSLLTLDQRLARVHTEQATG